MPVSVMARLLDTFKADWAAVDITAAVNPMASNVGVFHDAAPIPTPMGLNRAGSAGKALGPSSSAVNRTVMFHDAAPIPTPMGMGLNRAGNAGKALGPSSSAVNRTVTRGIPHLEVYVREIPIRSKAMLCYIYID
jgi:hypothetical protein